jgi:lysozyme
MNMNSILSRIMEEEGLRLTPYHDSVGVLTIGYGTNLTKIDEAEATFLLQHRLLLASDDLLRAFPWVRDLDDARAGVLLDMTYNMGIARLAGFTKMLAAVRAGDYDAASVEMLNSLWAYQVGPRADRLAAIMQTGKEIT